MQNMLAIFLFISGIIGCSNALTIGPFENVSSGIWDEWNRVNPENIKQGNFALRYGYGNLWFVSRRLYRPGLESPWDPASRGGIVSTLRVSTKQWSHKPYDRLDEDKYGDKLFSLNGRLFMLTYGIDTRKIMYHKLFYWHDENSRWNELPFTIDPNATTLSTNSIQTLVVSVPKQEGKVAYFVASAHAQATRGSEMAYSKLDVQFTGNTPNKASLKGIARKEDTKPSAVLYAATHNNTLYALIQNFYSEGYTPEPEMAYTLDLTTNRIGNVSLGGTHPLVLFEEERVLHTKQGEVLILGGNKMVGLGHYEYDRAIWSLDLNTLQWEKCNSSVPVDSGSGAALDQQRGKLYLAGLKEGVRAAQISE